MFLEILPHFQLPPLNFMDVMLQLAIGTIILLMTAELSPVLYIPVNYMLSKKRLEVAGTVTGILFLALVVFKVYTIISPNVPI